MSIVWKSFGAESPEFLVKNPSIKLLNSEHATAIVHSSKNRVTKVVADHGSEFSG